MYGIHQSFYCSVLVMNGITKTVKDLGFVCLFKVGFTRARC